MKTGPYITLLFFSILMGQAVAAVDVNAVKAAVRSRGAAWTAEENALTRMSAAERRKRLGLSEAPFPRAGVPVLALPKLPSLPSAFDWRSNSGNWVTPVRDQGSCGSCWAFSALAQVEAWWNISNLKPGYDIDLSEQFLVSCSGAGDCENGGLVSSALDFVRDTGVPSEKSLPYQARTNVPCSSAAADWAASAVTIPAWGYITGGEAQVENIKTALLYHPVSASFEVFADFYAYRSGVYEHVFGDAEGWHAVLIVGWNDDERCWIVKNSWGPEWGEQGYFRIRWGDSNFGKYNEFIWDELSYGRLSLSKNTLNVEVEYGRRDTLSFEIRNVGGAPVQFFAMEGEANDDEGDWLTLIGSAGLLPAGGAAEVKVVVDGRAVPPGTYRRTVVVGGNTLDRRLLECRLDVRRPAVDGRVIAVSLPEGGLPLLTSAAVTAEIDNFGLRPLENASAVCRIVRGTEEVFADTVKLPLLNAGQKLSCAFKPYKAVGLGSLHISVRLLGGDGDVNDFNNEMTAEADVTNTIDDFEGADDRWDLRGGWGITSKLNGRVGPGAAHVNNGDFPYPNNMNALLTFAPGFESDGIDSLFVTYWTRFLTADDGDRCFVDISGDGVQWSTVDQFGGVQPAWRRRLIDLTPVLADGEKVWFRFRFVSDEEGGSIGVLIDDVELFTSRPAMEEQPSGTLVADAERPLLWRQPINYPNPFNGETVIRYDLPEPAWVRLTVVDSNGRTTAQLVAERQDAGTHEIKWSADVPSGVYFALLEAKTSGGIVTTKRKMVLIK